MSATHNKTCCLLRQENKKFEIHGYFVTIVTDAQVNMIYLFTEVNECVTARLCKIFRMILKVCVKYNLSLQLRPEADVLPTAFSVGMSRFAYEIFVEAIAQT
jgi:hypothetical protein